MGAVFEDETSDDFEVCQPVVEGLEGGVALLGGILDFAFFFFLGAFEDFGLVNLGLGVGVGEEGYVEVPRLFVPGGVEFGFGLVEVEVGLA